MRCVRSRATINTARLRGAAECQSERGTLNQFYSFSSSQAAITNSLPLVSRSLTATSLQNALKLSPDVASVNLAVVSLILRPPRLFSVKSWGPRWIGLVPGKCVRVLNDSTWEPVQT